MDWINSRADCETIQEQQEWLEAQMENDCGVPDVATAALLRLTSPRASKELRGFWIHLAADVINPTVMPAVDSPEAGGLTINEVVIF